MMGTKNSAIMATFRPSAGDIAVFVEDGGRHSSTTLALAEAAQLHATLGSALQLAGHRQYPVAAFEQLSAWALCQAVAAVVRGEETDVWAPAARFARRIEAGEADDSEPMRIALAAVAAVREAV